jgi:hypothetical protein
MTLWQARCLLGLVLLLPVFGVAQTWPSTRAEKSNFTETSHYEDVIAFLQDLQKAGAPVTVQMIGKSTEGRDIPLAIASFPPISSAAEARRLNRPVIYIQANIHAGEVEGKEAALIVLRRLCQQGRTGILGRTVLLMTPIYNIDGNEKFGPVERNRPEQDGPALVGVRPNGQGFDLNRDAIKAEAPETQAVLQHVYSAWDPDVMMDLHTTDGTRHGWELTYAPGQNPNTDPEIMRITRDQLIGTVRRQMDQEKLPLFDYGNTEKRGNETAWYTFGEEGRYCTNYVGLRNRIAILSEATTYIPFRDRVHFTDRFVTRILEYVDAHAKQILNATRAADAKVVAWGEDPSKAPAMGVRFDFDGRGVDTVLLERPLANGQKAPITSRPAAIDAVRMPVYDRFKAIRTSRFPAAYIIPASESKAVELLRRHGIAVEKLRSDWSGPGEQFAVQEVKVPPREFQKHKLRELNGSFVSATVQAHAGDFIVRTAQPLGVLAFHILEPESLDGVVSWEVLSASPQVGDIYPVRKVFRRLDAASVGFFDFRF